MAAECRMRCSRRFLATVLPPSPPAKVRAWGFTCAVTLLSFTAGKSKSTHNAIWAPPSRSRYLLIERDRTLPLPLAEPLNRDRHFLNDGSGSLPTRHPERSEGSRDSSPLRGSE